MLKLRVVLKQVPRQRDFDYAANFMFKLNRFRGTGEPIDKLLKSLYGPWQPDYYPEAITANSAYVCTSNDELNILGP